MDTMLCYRCKYYMKQLLTEENLCSYNYIYADNSHSFFEKCEDALKHNSRYGSSQCNNFEEKQRQNSSYKWGHYEIPKINLKTPVLIEKNIIGKDKMKNDNFKTVLRSNNDKECRYLSIVEVNCENYNTFKEIIEALMPILEKEDVKKCD